MSPAEILDQRLKELEPAAVEYLQILFDMQEGLNNRVIHKDMHQPVPNMAAIHEHGDSDPITIARVTYWATSYARALLHEVVEFEASFPWKWWSKNKTIQHQNIPVELADMLHFFSSMCIVSRVTPAQLLSAYRQKMLINHQRQDQGYDDKKKDETDNRSVKV